MKHSIVIFLSVLALNVVSAQKESGESSVALLGPVAFNKNLVDNPNYQLVDIRTPKEFNSGHLKNAVNIDFYDKDFLSKMSQLDKKKPIYIYCHIGGRSGRAARQLKNTGFVKVVDLKGGIVAWKKESLPLVK